MEGEIGGLRVGKSLRLPPESLSLHTAHNNAFFFCVQNMRRCKTLFCKFEDYLFFSVLDGKPVVLQEPESADA